MMKLWALLAICINFKVSAQGLDGAPVPCEGACPNVVLKYYEAKGCEPVFDDSVSVCCPSSYDCSSVKRDPTKCYYKGVPYSDAEDMPIENPCEIGCRCSTRGGWPTAECAQVECPSLFNRDLHQCKKFHSIDSCCPELSNCPESVGFQPSIPDGGPEASTANVSCEVEGKGYQLGDKIYPEADHCQYCVCTENFTGIYGAGCRTIDCGVEYRDRRELEEGCTPIFYRNQCCFLDWLCPGSTVLGTQTDAVEIPEGTDTSRNYCTLGTIVLPLNATLVTTQDDTNCFCSTPPDFTCIQYPSAEEAKTAFEKGVRSP